LACGPKAAQRRAPRRPRQRVRHPDSGESRLSTRKGTPDRRGPPVGRCGRGGADWAGLGNVLGRRGRGVWAAGEEKEREREVGWAENEKERKELVFYF